MQFELGEIVHLKKKHPCGGYDWEVVRLGADIAIRCLKCSRRILVSRSSLERIIKIPKEPRG